MATRFVSGPKVNKANPVHSQDIDGSGRFGLNTVFGERVIGTRKADINPLDSTIEYSTDAVLTSGTYYLALRWKEWF